MSIAYTDLKLREERGLNNRPLRELHTPEIGRA